MKTKKVIDYRYLPTQFPLSQTAVLWLLLDRFHVHGWLLGAIWTVAAISWAAVLYRVIHENGVPPSVIP